MPDKSRMSKRPDKSRMSKRPVMGNYVVLFSELQELYLELRSLDMQLMELKIISWTYIFIPIALLFLRASLGEFACGAKNLWLNSLDDSLSRGMGHLRRLVEARSGLENLTPAPDMIVTRDYTVSLSQLDAIWTADSDRAALWSPTGAHNTEAFEYCFLDPFEYYFLDPKEIPVLYGPGGKTVQNFYTRVVLDINWALMKIPNLNPELNLELMSSSGCSDDGISEDRLRKVLKHKSIQFPPRGRAPSFTRLAELSACFGRALEIYENHLKGDLAAKKKKRNALAINLDKVRNEVKSWHNNYENIAAAHILAIIISVVIEPVITRPRYKSAAKKKYSINSSLYWDRKELALLISDAKADKGWYENRNPYFVAMTKFSYIFIFSFMGWLLTWKAVCSVFFVNMLVNMLVKGLEYALVALGKYRAKHSFENMRSNISCLFKDSEIGIDITIHPYSDHQAAILQLEIPSIDETIFNKDMISSLVEMILSRKGVEFYSIQNDNIFIPAPQPTGMLVSLRIQAWIEKVRVANIIKSQIKGHFDSPQCKIEYLFNTSDSLLYPYLHWNVTEIHDELKLWCEERGKLKEISFVDEAVDGFSSKVFMVIPKELEHGQIQAIKDFFSERYPRKNPSAAWCSSSLDVGGCRVKKTSKVATNKPVTVFKPISGNATSCHSWEVDGERLTPQHEDVESISGFPYKAYIYYRGHLSAEYIKKNDNQCARKLRDAGRKVAAHRMGDSGLKCERLPGTIFSPESTPWRIKLRRRDHGVTCKVTILPQDTGPKNTGPRLFITAKKIIWNYKHDNPGRSLQGGVSI